MDMELIVKVPGSCGEFAQGMLNNEPFLITCPINLFTVVTVSNEFSGQVGLGWKSKLMLKRTLNYLGYKKFNFGIALESELPHGKGMASSSADIAAIAKAAALALGVNLTASEIAKLATSIDPTDGIFFDGIVAMNPVNGNVLRRFNQMPEYKIAIFDFGGKINTLKFKRRSNFYLTELPAKLNLDLATTSSLANQDILHKLHLEEIIQLAKSMGALGVNVAHTGTVMGIFFDEDTRELEIESKSQIISSRFPKIKFMTTSKLISGGFNVIVNER